MVPLIWSPGPNNVMCATVGAKQGTAGSIPFIVGLNIPIFLYALLTGFGLSAVLLKFPEFGLAFTILGSMYVIYLGSRLAFSTSSSEADAIQYGFKSGFIISALNFKVVTVLVVMYSQFVSKDLIYTLELSCGFVVVCLVGHLLWNTLGQVSGKLVNDPRFLKVQNSTYGLMLIGVGFWMVIPSLKIALAGN